MTTPNITYARIQNNRGHRQDIPQPLMPGEFYLSEDTREVFLGADPDDPSGVSDPIIYVYGEYVGSFTDYAANYTETYLSVTNTILDEHLVQVDLAAGDSWPTISEDLTNTTQPSVMVRVEITDTNDTVVHRRAYIAYQSSQASTPSYPEVTGGTVQFLGNIRQFYGRNLNFSGITQSGYPYTVNDTSAITKLINWTFDNSSVFTSAPGSGKGIATVSQNIELLTDFNDKYDIELSTIQRTLENNASETPSGLWFSLVDSDCYSILYSIKNDDYIRNGTLKISAIGTETIVTDEFQETGSTFPTVNFSTSFVTGTNNSVIQVDYTASGLPTGDATKFSSNINRWNSY